MELNEMPTVHGFKIWDQGRYVVPRSKRTSEQIAQMGGEVIPDTAEEVEASEFDGDGRYNPKTARRESE
jgi:hypothetical protein